MSIKKSSTFQSILCSDLQVTILDTQTESDGVDLGGTSLVAIDIPSGFDGAALTFKVSTDGTNYKDYKRMSDGNDVTAVVAANASYAAGAFDFAGYRYLKLVSDTAQSSGDVVITLKTRPV